LGSAEGSGGRLDLGLGCGALDLDRLEVVHERAQLAAGRRVTITGVGGGLGEALAPHRHLAATVRGDLGAAIHEGHDLGGGELPAATLGDPREVGRDSAQGLGERAITAGAAPMTRGAVLHKERLAALGGLGGISGRQLGGAEREGEGEGGEDLARAHGTPRA
jgi:hypothetical protein